MERQSWKTFRDKPNKKDKKAFDDMWILAKLGRHENMAMMATKPVPFQIMMISMLFQRYMLLIQLEKRLKSGESPPERETFIQDLTGQKPRIPRSDEGMALLDTT